MTDASLAFLPRTTTLTLLTDWPLSKPNRDLGGDQKAAVIQGVRRHVLRGRLRSARRLGEREAEGSCRRFRKGAALLGGTPCGQRRAGRWSATSAPGRP